MIEKHKEKQHIPAATAFPFGSPGKKKPRIVFMGTPEFAVSSLDALLQAGYEVAAVVTAPDKPGGRGMELQQSAVKKFAVEKRLPVLQPLKLRDPEFIDSLKSINADLFVVVAFRMLPEMVWNMPPMGTINVHGSLLPQYRGAAPINWAIINGETKTGVTTFKLKHDIDTGNILLQESFPITATDDAGTVHDTMKKAGAKLLVRTIEGLEQGSLQETPQVLAAGEQLHHAPKIFTETCQINWNQPVQQVHNLVRGLSPYPAAFTLMHEKKLKIFKTSTMPGTVSVSPGTFDTDHKTLLRFACIDGYIQVLELQLEGKKKMEVAEFLRGYRFQ